MSLRATARSEAISGFMEKRLNIIRRFLPEIASSLSLLAMTITQYA
jgi:hypothetical protein